MPTPYPTLPDWLFSWTGERAGAPSALPGAGDTAAPPSLADLLAGWSSGVGGTPPTDGAPTDGPTRGDALSGWMGVFERPGHVRNTSADEAIAGDADTDTLWFVGRANATVDLGRTTAQDTGYGTDTITGIDHATGGHGHDQLTGNANANRLIGGKGNDTLLGLDGDDRLSGKRGADSLSGGEGNDRLYGGRDADRLAGDAGNDRLWGGTGNDSLEGGEGNDSLWGGQGRDTLVGGAGDDVLRGDDHRDGRWAWGNTAGWLDLESGGREVGQGRAYTGHDALAGHDLWPNGVSRLLASGDTDSHAANNAQDTSATFGTGWLSDTLHTSPRRTTPSPFDDRLDGGEGNDRLFGGMGNDTLMGGEGRDTLTGGSGADRFVFAPNGGEDTVTDFNRQQGDRIVLDQALFDEGTTLEDVVADYAANTAAGITIATEGGTTLLLEGVTTLSVADLAWA